MKTTDFLILLLIGSFTAFAGTGAAQQLPSLEKTSYGADHVQKVAMADFNRDDLLDLVLLSSSNPAVLSIHRNNGDDTFTEVAAFPAFEEPQLEILDLNLDNAPDIFVIGQVTADSVAALLLSSDGDFAFTEDYLSPGLREVSSFCWMQYNEDPLPDLFVSGISTRSEAPATKVLVKEGEEYRGHESSFKEELISKIVAVPDPENLYYIQTSSAVSPSGLYKFSPLGFEYIALDIPDFESSTLAQGDLDHDGAWDLFLYGRDKDGIAQGGVYFRRHDHYELFSLELEGSLQSAAIQDLNNDGLAELLLLRQEEGGGEVYITSDAAGYQFSKATLTGEDIYLTDYDKDGLPDFLVLSAAELSIFKQEAKEKNGFPQAPDIFLSLPMEQGLLFSWSEGKDDKTVEEALSYGLMLKDNATNTLVKSSLVNQESYFDLRHGYGSLGVENMFHYDQPVESNLTLTLTTFDNAHHTGPTSSFTTTVLGDSVSAISPCLTTYQKDTLVCAPVAADLAKLFGYEAQYWVSYSKGLQGHFSARDSLRESEMFYGIKMDEGCLEILYATIRFSDGEGFLSLVESCQGDSLTVNGREGSFSYQWFGPGGESLGNEQALTYVANNSEIITVENTLLGSECVITDTFQIEVLPYPQLDIIEPQNIREGEEVQLYASGADYYEWSPAGSLLNTSSASPTARPRETTTYYVKAWNTEACVVYDSVVVNITRDFFMPSLFSPNGDGKNDLFVVSGSGIAQLKLRIYDVKGTMVWEADSPDEARNGWNGSYKGRPLPPGNYAWELRGMFKDGSLLQFENKKSGYITLIR